jgi:A/G-specific adenine glycosylase
VDIEQDGAWYVAIRRRLPPWFRRMRRDLPWRRTKDPYAVWLSEVMLQQTQVAAVIPYFNRFLDAFPTIESLARGDESEVLRLWEGLGYYRRARQLLAAARMIVEQHEGRFPRLMEDLRRLPGIGRYTAGAILSIAFGQPQPILEGNTIRVWSRLLAHPLDVSQPSGQAPLWSAAEAILPRRGSGTVNQALMELGATICLPRAPHCGSCPLRGLCSAEALGTPEAFPIKKPSRPATDVTEAAIAVWRQGRILLVRSSGRGRWEGLWDFPRFAMSDENAAGSEQELASKTKRLSGVEVEVAGPLATMRHGVTRFRITLLCHQARAVRVGRAPTGTRRAWVRPAELDRYPLNVTARRLAGLAIRQGPVPAPGSSSGTRPRGSRRRRPIRA